jgi:hypothetical protein
MALSQEELELETAEILPAREVMGQVCGCGCGWGGSFYSHNQLSYTSAESNGFINVVSGDNVLSGNNLSLGI